MIYGKSTSVRVNLPEPRSISISVLVPFDPRYLPFINSLGHQFEIDVISP